jgi:hypothetical protein
LEFKHGAHWYGIAPDLRERLPFSTLGWFTKQNVDGIVALDKAPEVVEHYRQQGINTCLSQICLTLVERWKK